MQQMFSSSYSANPFQQFPSPPRSFCCLSTPPPPPPPPPSVALNDNFILLHHQDLLPGHLFPANAIAVETFSSMAGPNNATNPPPKKKNVDKDKHRKICTAQGPRHRRVRLSIGIARKFFGLQDLLGFDKASETLEWLLNKSKTAISKLEEHAKNGCIDSAKSLSSDCESLGTNEADDDDNEESKEKPLWSNFREVLARESRAKARARARARTREKMCTRKLKESEKIMISDSSYINLSSLKVDAEIDKSNYQVVPQENEALKEENMEESIVTKGLEASSECNNCSPSITQHEDISSSVTQSSSFAMNLSRDFQIYGKSWEVYDNHSQG